MTDGDWVTLRVENVTEGRVLSEDSMTREEALKRGQKALGTKLPDWMDIGDQMLAASRGNVRATIAQGVD